MINSIAIKCPICRDYIITKEVHKINFCNACKFEINYCNKHIEHICFKCINITLTTNINNNQIKERKYYGCHKGSRLVKYCKKYKIDKLEMIKYLRWGVCEELNSKEKLIRTAEYVYKQKESVDL